MLKKPAHSEIAVSKSLLPNPPLARFKRSFGEPKGQKANYELRRIHVREYDDEYRIHWDYVSPLANPLENLRSDAVRW